LFFVSPPGTKSSVDRIQDPHLGFARQSTHPDSLRIVSFTAPLQVNIQLLGREDLSFIAVRSRLFVQLCCSVSFSIDLALAASLVLVLDLTGAGRKRSYLEGAGGLGNFSSF
jgi:hypothetical protein